MGSPQWAREVSLIRIAISYPCGQYWGCNTRTTHSMQLTMRCCRRDPFVCSEKEIEEVLCRDGGAEQSKSNGVSAWRKTTRRLSDAWQDACWTTCSCVPHLVSSSCISITQGKNHVPLYTPHAVDQVREPIPGAVCASGGLSGIRNWIIELRRLGVKVRSQC